MSTSKKTPGTEPTADPTAPMSSLKPVTMPVLRVGMFQPALLLAVHAVGLLSV